MIALRIRTFLGVTILGVDLWRFQFSFFILMLGGRSNQLAIAIWTLQKTNSAIYFSTMIACAIASEILAKPLLSWVGDRYNKIRVVTFCNITTVISSALLVLLSLLDWFHPVAIGSLMILGSIAIGIRDPIQSSMIPLLVDTSKVSIAFRSKSMMSSLAILISPAVAGGLISYSGISAALTVSLTAAICATLLVKNIPPHTASIELQKKSSLNRVGMIISGFTIVYRVRVEFFLSILAMAVNFSLYPFFAILVPLYVTALLKLPVWYIGLLDSFFGLGILLGSYRAIEWIGKWMHRDISIAFGFALLGGNLLIAGFIPNPWLLPVAFFSGGIGLMLVNIHASTVRTLATPKLFRNRMNATTAFFSAAASPLGSLSVGILITAIGLNGTILAFGGLIVSLAALVFLIPNFKEVMRTSDQGLEGFYLKIYPLAFEINGIPPKNKVIVS